MSRIGLKPIDVPSAATVTIDGSTVTVKGAQGELTYVVPGVIKVEQTGATVVVSRGAETRQAKSFHGLVRSLIANMIEGVSKGYSKELEIQGVGFRAEAKGQKLLLSLGFASPKEYAIPDRIKIDIEGNGTQLKISGCDKQLVGLSAARIRSYFPAEPYKGKGIRYKGEQVRRKVGKTVA